MLMSDDLFFPFSASWQFITASSDRNSRLWLVNPCQYWPLIGQPCLSQTCEVCNGTWVSCIWLSHGMITLLRSSSRHVSLLWIVFINLRIEPKEISNIDEVINIFGQNRKTIGTRMWRNGLDIMFSQTSSVIFIYLTIMKTDQSDFWMNVLKSCVNSNLWKTDLISSMVRNLS